MNLVRFLATLTVLGGLTVVSQSSFAPAVGFLVAVMIAFFLAPPIWVVSSLTGLDFETVAAGCWTVYGCCVVALGIRAGRYLVAHNGDGARAAVAGAAILIALPLIGWHALEAIAGTQSN